MCELKYTLPRVQLGRLIVMLDASKALAGGLPVL